MKINPRNRKINPCSKLYVFTGVVGTNIESEFFIDMDGDTLLLVSIYDHKVLGYINLSKEDIKYLKKHLR